MTFGLEATAQAANSGTMQFSLKSSKTSASPKSGTGWDMASSQDSGASCSSTKYVGGGTFLTLSAVDGDYSLSVANSRDQFDVWKEYPVTLTMDGVEQSMNIRPIKFDTFVMPVSADAFKKAKHFDVAIGDRHYNFTDTKMTKVVAKLAKCGGVNTATSSSSTGNFANMSPAAGDTSMKVASNSATTTTTAAPSAKTTTGTATTTTDTTTTTTTIDPVTGEPSTDTTATTNTTTAPTEAVAPSDAAATVPMPDAASGNLAPVPTTPTPLDAAVTTAKDTAATGTQPVLDAKPMDSVAGPANVAVPTLVAPTPAPMDGVAPTLTPATTTTTTTTTTAAPAAAPAVPAVTTPEMPAPAAAATMPADLGLGATPAPSPATPAEALPPVTSMDATSAPTALTDTAKSDAAALEAAKTPVKTADTADTAKTADKPVKKAKKAKKTAAGPAPTKPISEDEAMENDKLGRTYTPQADQDKPCVKGQNCKITPVYAKETSETVLAQNAPLPEQTVTEVKQAAAVAVTPPPAPVAPMTAGEQCTSSDEYKNLVRKIGLLEAEKEQLRSSAGTSNLAPALQKVSQCASESYQIKELKTELAIIRKENADLRRQAEAVKGADNLNDALNELDETVKNGKK